MAGATSPWANGMRAWHRGRTQGRVATRGHDSGITGTRHAPPSLRSQFSRFPVKPTTEVLGDRPVPPLDQPAQRNTQGSSQVSRYSPKAPHIHILVFASRGCVGMPIDGTNKYRLNERDATYPTSGRITTTLALHSEHSTTTLMAAFQFLLQ